MEVEFTREPIDRLDGLFHRRLRAGDFIFEALDVDRGLLFQWQQPDIDSQSLGDFAVTMRSTYDS